MFTSRSAGHWGGEQGELSTTADYGGRPVPMTIISKIRSGNGEANQLPHSERGAKATTQV